MQVRLADLRSKLDLLRKSGKLGYWTLSYGENMWTRAGEYVQVGLFSEAQICAERLERWLSRHLPKIESNKKELSPIYAFDASYLLNILNFVSEVLKRKRMLIPAPERESTERHVERLRKRLESGELASLHDEILALRSGLIARLKSSGEDFMGFKSYCWSIGTTSFRVDQLNYKNECQLRYLNELFTSNPNMEWDKCDF